MEEQLNMMLPWQTVQTANEQEDGRHHSGI